MTPGDVNGYDRHLKVERIEQRVHEAERIAAVGNTVDPEVPARVGGGIPGTLDEDDGRVRQRSACSQRVIDRAGNTSLCLGTHREQRKYTTCKPSSDSQIVPAAGYVVPNGIHANSACSKGSR